MKLAISNIAWPEDAEAEVAELLRSEGVTGLEVAPTKTLGTPASVSETLVDRVRCEWANRGIPIVAAHALLFGQPDLLMFGEEARREQCLVYLDKVVRVVGRLGAQAQVFGSPKNRCLGELSLPEAWPIAVEFFRRLGQSAIEARTQVAIEAIPAEYETDFLNSSLDALRLVRDVDHPGIGLHLDTACMHLAGDDPVALVEDAGPLLIHFHVSEPNLGLVGAGNFPHEKFAAALQSVPYEGWISIEMRTADPFSLEAIRNAIRMVREVYGSPRA